MIEYLASQLYNNNIEFTPNKLQMLMQYHDLLYQTNEIINLTRIPSGKEAIDKHFIDSLIALKAYNFHGKSIVDIGTGAGFPGIPLAIFVDDSNFLLIDSLNKRIMFIDKVLQALNIKNVECLHIRAEDAGRAVQYREKFDIAVSRALSNMSVLSEYMLPLVKLGGVAIAYKGNVSEEELTDSQYAMKEMGSEKYSVYDASISGTDLVRKFIIMNKTTATPKKYPRRSTNINKKPLI